MSMKVLVVGYGSIGKRHVKNLLKIPNVKIILCTKQKNIKHMKKKCIVNENLIKCLDYNPDAAIIANNTNEHMKTAIKLANANVHLFIEKPLSHSLSDVDKLKKIVEKKNLITMIGCNLRFHRCIMKIKDLINSKAIGRILSVESESGSYLPEWHPKEDYRKSYASREKLGGGVILTCIHEIDYLFWFFGKIKEVFSNSGNFSDLKISSEDLSTSIITFKNNILCELHLDYFQRPQIRQCKIIGTKGTINWNSNSNTVSLYDIRKKKWVEKLKIKNYDRNTMYVDELSHFLDCIKKSTQSINPLNEGILTLKTALAIKKSSKTRKIVKIV